MANRSEAGIQHEGEKFAHLPNSYKELSSARELLGARLAPFIARLRDRYGYLSPRGKKEIVGSQEYLVTPVGSSRNPSMSFYAENEDASQRSTIIITTDAAKRRIDRIERVATSVAEDGKHIIINDEIDFAHNHVRIEQDADHPENPDRGQYFSLDTSRIHKIATLGITSESKDAIIPLVTVTGDEELLSNMLGNLTTDLRTGLRKIEGELGTFYLPPADQLLAHMVRQALNFERVSLPQRPI